MQLFLLENCYAFFDTFFRDMKICIILLLWLNIKLAFSSEISEEAYYELVPQVQQNSCQILKKIGGAWMKNCGFWDGEKLICMDKLYPSIKNDSCLVYSFGLSDNWDFEIIMASTGKFQLDNFNADFHQF